MENDTVCRFEVTGNKNQDVELCLTPGIFIADVPQTIKRRYDQIIGILDTNQLVKVKGNMPTLEETIWLLRNLDRVNSISVTSPTARLKELDLEFKLSIWNSDRNSMDGTRKLSINRSGEFTSPSKVIIDLTETPFVASTPHLFMSINVPARSFFNLSFAGHLKDSITPPLLMQKNNPLVCKSCGAPLHGGKCNYCGTEY